MDLERICRSHIRHRKRLITVNPFTSLWAGVNTKRPKNIFIHLCLGQFYIAQPTLCQLCLLTISHCELPSCLCGPSDLPSPSICKDEGLIKTIFPINIPGPWSPGSRAGRPPGPPPVLLRTWSLFSYSTTKTLCMTWTEPVDMTGFAEKDVSSPPPPSFPQESKLARLVFKYITVCVHLCTVCVYKRRRGNEIGGKGGR